MTALTDDAPAVVAVCGSRREASKTRVALEATLDAAQTRGGRTRLVDLRELDVPALDPDAPAPPDVEHLQAVIDDADGVVLGTPNYHGSYSGALKDALDHLGRDEFAGTTVGLLEVAGGSYPGSAIAHLREVARTLNAWTLPVEVAVPASHSTVRADGIVDEDVAGRVEALGRDVVDYARIDEHPPFRPAAATGD